MQEIARLEGVPPNMSVRMATPSPLSTRLTASIMSRRHKSESSSAPIVTAFDLLLRTHDMFGADLEFVGKAPMGHKHSTNHRQTPRGCLLVHRTNAHTLTIQSPEQEGIFASLREVVGGRKESRRRGLIGRAIMGLIWLPIPLQASSEGWG